MLLKGSHMTWANPRWPTFSN